MIKGILSSYAAPLYRFHLDVEEPEVPPQLCPLIGLSES